MKRAFFVLASFALLSTGALEARVYKGQKEFIKKCRECHNNGQELAYSKLRREWDNLFSQEGKLLAEIHLKNTDKKVKVSHDYFESARYTKKVEDLKDFFKEYAKDSGNVPACD